MTGEQWARISKRIRVPSGFALAALFVWQSHPTALSLTGGTALIAIGLVIRGLASGYIKKNEQLATTGPYAFTRNPLYLGSLVLACGFALAGLSVVTLAAIVLLYFAIYRPTILGEERFLRDKFPGFDQYARRVPRLVPTFTRATGASPAFSAAMYMRHREYQASIGAGALLILLVAKLVLAGNHR